MNKPTKIIILLLLLQIGGVSAYAQTDSIVYSLELVSIDTLKIEKKEPPIKAKHHYRYFTDISGKEEKVAGIISYLPEQYIFGGIDYEDFNQRYNDYSSRTIELPNGNIFKVDGYYRKVFANIENQRIYTYGYSFKYDGKPNHEKYNLSFIDFEGKVLNSYEDKYKIEDAEFAKDGSLIADCIIKIDSVTTEHALCYFDKNGNLKWTHKKSSGKYLVTLTLSNTGKYIAFVENSWIDKEKKEEMQTIYVLDNNGNVVYKSETNGKKLMGFIRYFNEDDTYFSYTEQEYFVIYNLKDNKRVIRLNLCCFRQFYINEELDVLIIIKSERNSKKSLRVYDLKTEELLCKYYFYNSSCNLKVTKQNDIIVEGNRIFNFKLIKNEK